MSDDNGLKSGRPRDSSIDERVLVVARELLTQNGTEVKAAPPWLLLALKETDSLCKALWSNFSGPAVALFSEDWLRRHSIVAPMVSKSVNGAAFSPTVHSGTRRIVIDTENRLT